MYFETYVGSEVTKMRIERAEKSASQAWRFKKLQPRSTKVLNAMLTSILGLFIR